MVSKIEFYTPIIPNNKGWQEYFLLYYNCIVILLNLVCGNFIDFISSFFYISSMDVVENCFILFHKNFICS